MEVEMLFNAERARGLMSDVGVDVLIAENSGRP